MNTVEIAARLGLPKTTVSHWCRILGVAAPPCAANGNPGAYSAEDDALLWANRHLGHGKLALMLTQRDPARPRRTASVRLRLIILHNQHRNRLAAEQAARDAACPTCTEPVRCNEIGRRCDIEEVLSA
jgi:hypothetical protein